VMEKGLRRPSDMEKVKSVAFVQCVGSRVETRGVPYCSAICCTNAIKNAIAAKEMDNSVDVFVLYIDIRTHGKGYEALYKAAREKGVRFIRGQPSMVVKKPGSERLLVVGENTLIKELYEIPVDLVVLSVGLRQSHGTDELLGMLEISTDRDGLIGEDSRFESTSTSAQGVFVAGCAEAPKDVRDSIAQGEAAALAATRYIVASRQGKSIS
jgi:heterodisulfide reductase subunit A